ncbi:MAG TPA: diguanylate cyclase [Polyangiales bacterium]|nr:diguanylate cyclase [Polyangiales bacterium]
MVAPPKPPDEDARLMALAALEILDTEPEQEFDAIVKLAAEICEVPIALVSLVDERRQWFKARVGLETRETPRDVAYCAHAISEDRTLIVPNAALDARFKDNPLRTGPPRAEFYAGVPLRTGAGHNIGTLCVIDHFPRSLSAAQQSALEALAAQVVRLLELRRTALLQRETLASMRASDAVLRHAHESVAPRVREWSRSAFVLACVLGVSALLASFWVRSTVSAASAARLERAAERGAFFVQERARAYAQIVRGAGALFRGSEHVTGEELRRYAEGLELEGNYPGLLGLGYAERVPRTRLDAWLTQIRREHPDFQLVSSGDAPELVINKLIEPLAANRPALGFDIASEPIRASAIAASRRTGDIAVTSRVRLRQDVAGGPGFLMYLPVPVTGSSGSEIAGWVFAALRTRDVVAGMQEAAGANVELRLLGDAHPEPLFGAARAPDRPAHVLNVMLGDRRFRLEARPGGGFLTLSERSEAWAVLLLGLGATALAFALTTSMRRTEARSRTLATRLTTALHRGERELRAVIDGTTDLIITFGEDGRLILTNRTFRKVLGYDEMETSSVTVFDVVEPDARPAFELAVRREADEGVSRRVETVFMSRMGATIEVEGALSFFAENDRRVTRAIFRDVSSRRQAERALLAANEALERLATTDSLTGLGNRRVLDDRLADEVGRARRNGTELSVVLLDVDCFKLYNDHYGHLQGDECLKQVSAGLRSVARRAGELAARFGGEEFALVLPGSNAKGAAELAARARDRIESLAIPHAKHPLGVVTASFGVASLDAHTMHDAKALIAAADAALYRAKIGGRNRVELAA